MSEPDDPTPADYLRKLSAARSPAEVMAVVREFNERPPVPYRMAHETLRAYFGTGALNLTREGSLVAAGTMAAAVETLTVEAVVTATGEVIRPALTRPTTLPGMVRQVALRPADRDHDRRLAGSALGRAAH